MTRKSYRKAHGMIMTLSLAIAAPLCSYAEDSTEDQTAGQNAQQSGGESEGGTLPDMQGGGKGMGGVG